MNNYSKIYVVGQRPDPNENSNGIQFIVEYEQHGEIGFTYRNPEEFKSLFQSLKKQHAAFELPAVLIRELTKLSDKTKIEQTMLILTYFLELILTQGVSCLNFR